jgi:hypothetical protein
MTNELPMATLIGIEVLVTFYSVKQTRTNAARMV